MTSKIVLAFRLLATLVFLGAIGWVGWKLFALLVHRAMEF